MAHPDYGSKDVILSRFDFKWDLLCNEDSGSKEKEEKKPKKKKERHLNRPAEGARVTPGVCKDLLANELIHDVGQVGHHKQGDHRQREVRGFQCRPDGNLGCFLLFCSIQRNIFLTEQKCEERDFGSIQFDFHLDGIVMQRTW